MRSTPTPHVLHAREARVVEQDRDAVAGQADVELHAVTARDAHGGQERLERVLRGDPPVATVGEPQGPPAGHGHRHQTARELTPEPGHASRPSR